MSGGGIETLTSTRTRRVKPAVVEMSDNAKVEKLFERPELVTLKDKIDEFKALGFTNEHILNLAKEVSAIDQTRVLRFYLENIPLLQKFQDAGFTANQLHDFSFKGERVVSSSYTNLDRLKTAFATHESLTPQHLRQCITNGSRLGTQQDFTDYLRGVGVSHLKNTIKAAIARAESEAGHGGGSVAAGRKRPRDDASLPVSEAKSARVGNLALLITALEGVASAEGGGGAPEGAIDDMPAVLDGLATFTDVYKNLRTLDDIFTTMDTVAWRRAIELNGINILTEVLLKTADDPFLPNYASKLLRRLIIAMPEPARTEHLATLEESDNVSLKKVAHQLYKELGRATLRPDLLSPLPSKPADFETFVTTTRAMLAKLSETTVTPVASND